MALHIENWCISLDKAQDLRNRNLCCRKVSAFSHNNSSLNRSAEVPSANQCPCYRLEGYVYLVEFSHWVFPSHEVLELTNARSNGVTCECGGGDSS